VLTRANNQETVEPALQIAPIPNLSFVFYDLPRWARWWKRGGRGVHLYYILWQAAIYRYARRRLPIDEYDLIHHLTFGGFRQPSFLGRLGRPFLVGPVGGGESAPKKLRSTFPVHGRLKDAIRDLSNVIATFDPTVRQMFSRATWIFCKTPESLRILPEKFRSKARVTLEIGVEQHWFGEEKQCEGRTFVSVGRLLYWKGTHLTLEAFAEVLREFPNARLKLIGIGPDEAWLKKKTHTLGIAHAVEWLGWQSQQAVKSEIETSVAVVFPSLHDSSGNVALESMAAGAPVICLDTGGPATIVPDGAGFRIPTKDVAPEKVVSDIAFAMKSLLEDGERRAAFSRAARSFALTRTWRAAVIDVYSTLGGSLKGWPNAND
jgi:glycosyltransferase involved in cell wall biosynthesis